MDLVILQSGADHFTDEQIEGKCLRRSLDKVRSGQVRSDQDRSPENATNAHSSPTWPNTLAFLKIRKFESPAAFQSKLGLYFS